jgi:hypothetical protein
LAARCLGVALGVCLGAFGCGDKPSEKDCKALLDKVIDLEVATAGTDKLSSEKKASLDKQRKQLAGYISERFIERCIKETPKAAIECGLKAKSQEDYAACEKP